MNSLLVFIGAGLGGVLRYQLSILILNSRIWNSGSFLINVIGCVLIGVAASLKLTDESKLFIIVGVLGGYTTFSAFSLETLQMIEKGEMAGALIHTLGTVIACLVAAYIGSMLVRG